MERMIDAKEVAELLGVNPNTVYHMKDKPGGLPAYRVGRLVRFKLSEVEEYIERQAVKPAEPDRPFCLNRFQYVPGMKVVSV